MSSRESALKFPLLSKASALGAVTLGLLWALMSVQSLVHERQARQHEAEDNVANSLAGSQTLLGPALVRTCSEAWVKGYEEGASRKAIVETTTQVIRLPATQLQMDARVEMAPRYRGIFKVNGYVTKAKLVARWADLSALSPKQEHEQGQLTCSATTVAFSVTDARGIQVADIAINGQAAGVQPGSDLGLQPVGFHSVLPEATLNQPGPTNVVVNLELAGTQSISVAPIADTTAVKLATDWPHPAFGGRFLPSERNVGEHGFDATWKITSLASTAQQEWTKGSPLCPALPNGEQLPYATRAAPDGNEPHSACVESFGVDFMDPINPYVLSDRATKYGLLFIALTFVGVGLVEVLKRLRVHPIQYLLVGAALAVFFLLLVSLSEHLAFGLAYLAASIACTLLLSFYGGFVLRGAKAGLAFGAGIGALFVTLYALLQMEQTALVLGSVLLFIVLAAVMISTRRLDWYELMGQMRKESA